MKKEQHLYLNILKSIAIIIICLIHFSSIYGGKITQKPYIFSLDSIRQFLYNIISIAIPLFFMVNGALLLNKNCDYKYVIKKIIHLIIQFIIWAFITLLIISIYRGITSNNFNISNVLSLSVLKSIPHSHLWFIPQLISIYILVPFIKSIYDSKDEKNYFYIFLIILAIFTFFIPLLNHLLNTVNLKMNFDYIYTFIPFSMNYMTMLLFFLSGAVLHNNKLKLINKSKKITLLLIIISLIFLHLEWYWYGDYYLGYKFNYNSISVLFLTFSIYIIIMQLEEKLLKIKPIVYISNFIGINTITVYYLHWILGYTILESIQPFLWINKGIIYSITISIILTIICSAIGYLIKKIPFINKII